MMKSQPAALTKQGKNCSGRAGGAEGSRRRAQKGELIVVFYENLEPLRDYLESAGAKAGVRGRKSEVRVRKGGSDELPQ